MAPVDVRRRGIHSEIYAQRLLLFNGLFELPLQLILSDNFGHALLQIRELFLNRLELRSSHYFFSDASSEVINTRRPSTRNLPSSTMRTASAYMRCSSRKMRSESVSGVSLSSIGTQACNTIAPASRFSSTKCTVQPENLAPCSRAWR